MEFDLINLSDCAKKKPLSEPSQYQSEGGIPIRCRLLKNFIHNYSYKYFFINVSVRIIFIISVD